MIGLADCNSFYASCEKLFRPDLRDRPVVVLSNNDGCIVALSPEAKRLGIKRGEAYFKCRDNLEKHNVAVFSSNYTLYQDISDRTLETLKSLAQEVEPYSIDESFFTPPVSSDFEGYAMRLHNTLRRRTGLMISVGIARTKTLSKIANHIGKKGFGWYYLRPSEEKKVLQETPIGEVWGVGFRHEKKMLHLGIHTAWDLIQKPDSWIQKTFSITGMRTVAELRGQSCITEEDFERRSFASGISFDEPKTSMEELQQTLSCHCEVLSNKLVNNGFSASSVFVQLLTSRFKDDFYYGSAAIGLYQATSYAPGLLSGAKMVLSKIYRPGLLYKSSRVGVYNLTPVGVRQWSLFDSPEYKQRQMKEDIMAHLVCRIPGLRCLSSGMMDKREICLRGHLSPKYTTQWTDIPKVN